MEVSINNEFDVFFNDYKNNPGDLNANMKIILEKYIPNQINEIFITFKNSSDKLLIIIEYINKFYIDKNKILFENNDIYSIDNENINEWTQMNFPIIVNLINVLVNQEKLENYIVNSISNYIGNCIKFLWNKEDEIIKIFDLIENIYSNNGLNNLLINYRLSKVLYYIINNFFISTHVYGYFKFKKLCNKFSNILLKRLLVINRNNLNSIIVWFNNNPNDKNLESLLKLNLEILLKILNFPFNMNYYDFNNGTNPNEVTIIWYLEELSFFFHDFNLMNNLFLILKYIPNENNLNFLNIKWIVSRILNKIIVCRISIFSDEEQKLNFKTIMINNIESFLNIIFLHEPIKEQIMAEFLEYLIKIIFSFGLRLILSKPELKEKFLKNFDIFCLNFINANSLSVSNNNTIKFFELLKKFKNTKNMFDNFNYKLNNLFDIYLNKFILNDNKIFFDKNYNNHKKFIKLIDNRFKYFDEFSMELLDKSSYLLEKYLPNISDLFSYILLNYENNILEDNLESYLSKIMHYYLMVIFFLVKIQNYSYSNQYTSGFRDLHNDGLEEIFLNKNSNILVILIKNVDLIYNLRLKFNTAALINYEMTIIYFLNYLCSCFLDNLDIDNESHVLKIDDQYFKILMDNNIFESINDFINYYFNYIFNNLKSNNKIILKYSIFSLKQLITKLKKLDKVNGKDHPILSQLFNKLLNIGDTIFVNPEKYRLRKFYFELISNCLFYDWSDNYIENSHLICNLLLNNVEFSINSYSRILRDYSGILSSIEYSKIFISFIRINYPGIKNLLANCDNSFWNNYLFITSLIEFYSNCFNNSSERIEFNSSSTVMVDIIKDANNIIGNLVNEIYTMLEKNNSLVETFFSDNLNMVVKILRLFLSLWKYKQSTFSIIHFFGDNNFILFINNSVNFILYFFNTIELFPNYIPLFRDVFNHLINNFFDMIIENCNVDLFAKILNVISYFYNEYYNIFKEESELKNNNENRLLYIEKLVSKISEYFYNELKVEENSEKLNKMKNILVSNQDKIATLILNLFATSYSIKFSDDILNIISRIIFNFMLIINKDHIDSIFKNFINELPYYSQDKLSLYNDLIKDLNLNLNSYNFDLFRDNFKIVINKIEKLRPIINN